jgi:Ca2+-binding EF-hand superfamily protein
MVARYLFLSFGAALSLAAPAAAQFDRAGVSRMLDAIERADANKDGKTTNAEFANARRAQFGGLRATNGFLDAAKAKAAGVQVADLDADDDGRVSEAEFVTHKPRAWDRLDRDDDGALSREEVARLKSRMSR